MFQQTSSYLFIFANLWWCFGYFNCGGYCQSSVADYSTVKGVSMLYTPTQGICTTSRALYPTLKLKRASRAWRRGISSAGFRNSCHGGGQLWWVKEAQVFMWSVLQLSLLSVAETLPWGMWLGSLLVANDSSLQKWFTVNQFHPREQILSTLLSAHNWQWPPNCLQFPCCFSPCGLVSWGPSELIILTFPTYGSFSLALTPCTSASWQPWSKSQKGLACYLASSYLNAPSLDYILWSPKLVIGAGPTRCTRSACRETVQNTFPQVFSLEDLAWIKMRPGIINLKHLFLPPELWASCLLGD